MPLAVRDAKNYEVLFVGAGESVSAGQIVVSKCFGSRITRSDSAAELKKMRNNFVTDLSLVVRLVEDDRGEGGGTSLNSKARATAAGKWPDALSRRDHAPTY